MEPQVANITLTLAASASPGRNADRDEDPPGAARTYDVALTLDDAATIAGTAVFDPGAELTGGVQPRELLSEFYAHSARALDGCQTLGRFLWARLFAESSPEIAAAWAAAETARRTAGRPLVMSVRVIDGGLDLWPLEVLADGDGFVFWRPGNRLEIACEHDEDSGARARRMVATGRLHAYEERFESARELYYDAIAMCDRRHDRRGEALARLALGDLFVAWDRPGEAGDAYLSALPVFETLGELDGEAATRRALGELYLRIKRWDDAAAAFRDAASLYARLGDPAGEAGAALGLGNLALLRGDPRQAYAQFREALLLHERCEDDLGRAATHGYMARAAYELGEIDRAAMLAAHAWAMFREDADEFGQRVALDDLTRILHEKGDIQGAVAAMFMAWVAARNLSESTAEDRAQRLARALADFNPRVPSPAVYRKLEQVMFSSLAACQDVLAARGEDPRESLPASVASPGGDDAGGERDGDADDGS